MKEEKTGVDRRRAWLIRALIAAAAPVVLLGGVLLGIGWYYSSQIESGAFEIDNGPSELNLRIETIAGGEVALARVSGGTRLDEGGILGLEGANGYGRLGDVRQSESDRVVRAFAPFDGTLAAGDLVRLDRGAFPPDPRRALGLNYQDVVVHAKIGDLPAWFVPGAGDVWAIMVHGRTAKRAEALRVLGAVADFGMPALVISYRNDAGVPEDPSGKYQFGLTEWEDLEAAVEYARANGARRVVLVGLSMGGGIVASFMYTSPLAADVNGLILDSPMLSLSDVVDLAAGQRGLPGIVAATARRISSTRFGTDWEALDFLQDVDRLSVPVLLFHGTGDRTVPVAVSDRLAAERPDIVTYVRVENAEHVGSWNMDPDRYSSAVRTFLDGGPGR